MFGHTNSIGSETWRHYSNSLAPCFTIPGAHNHNSTGQSVTLYRTLATPRLVSSASNATPVRADAYRSALMSCARCMYRSLLHGQCARTGPVRGTPVRADTSVLLQASDLTGGTTPAQRRDTVRQSGAEVVASHRRLPSPHDRVRSDDTHRSTSPDVCHCRPPPQ